MLSVDGVGEFDQEALFQLDCSLVDAGSRGVNGIFLRLYYHIQGVQNIVFLVHTFNILVDQTTIQGRNTLLNLSCHFLLLDNLADVFYLII